MAMNQVRSYYSILVDYCLLITCCVFVVLCTYRCRSSSLLFMIPLIYAGARQHAATSDTTDVAEI